MLGSNLPYKNMRIVATCFYVGLVLAISASAAMAQDAPGSATSILENAIEVSKSSEEGLNDLWQMTFAGGYSPGYIAVMDFAQKVMVIPFFWMFIPVAQAFVFNKYEEIFRHVAWLVLVAMLTAGNYGLITKISYGSRNFVNDTTRGILTYQLGPVTMQDALTDVLITEQAEATIQFLLAECESKEGQEQLKCFEDGAVRAKKELAAIKDANRLSGIQTLLARLNKIIQVASDETDDPFNATANVLYNFTFLPAGQALAQQLMKAFQSAMMTIIDVGFYLTAMLGPVAVAATLAPLKPRVLFIWGAGFFAFALMKMSYNILIGAIATVALTITGDFGSTGLLIAMAVLSPLLAMAMGGWGGARLVQAMAGGATAIIAMVPAPTPRPK